MLRIVTVHPATVDEHNWVRILDGRQRAVFKDESGICPIYIDGPI